MEQSKTDNKIPFPTDKVESTTPDPKAEPQAKPQQEQKDHDTKK